MMKLNSKKGFSIAEVLVTTGVLSIAIVGLLRLFIYCSVLSEGSGNISQALREAQDTLEQIRASDYDQIWANFDETTFVLNGVNGIGIIYVDNSNADLLEISVVVSYMNKDGRVIGEDQNLDGDLDAGEDQDADGLLDSEATIISMIAKR